MKNPAPFIREKLIALLNETITYNGVDVPCYEGQGEVTPYQILVAEQSDFNRSTRDSFNWRFEQVIEVVSEQQTNLRKHVDSIGGSVMNILKPTTKTTGLTGNADFQVIGVRKEGQRYLDEVSGEGSFINRLILRCSFLLTEK